MSGDQTIALRRRARIYLIIDHPIMQEGMVALLEGTRDLCVCGVALDGMHVPEAIESLRPDAVVAERRLHGRDRIDLIQAIKRRCPEVPVLALFISAWSADATEIMAAGADACLSHPEKAGKLLHTLRGLLKSSSATSPVAV